MWTPRRRKGFELAGTVRPAALGLAKAPTTRMKLLLAWRQIAGPALEDLADVSLKRGLLDVVAGQPDATALLEPVLPLIASRMARRYPELKIQRFRLGTAGDSSPRMPARAIDPIGDALAEPGQAATRPSQRARTTTIRRAEVPDPDELLRRLEAVSRRYIDRQSRTDQKP